jgi:hypothetical protein
VVLSHFTADLVIFNWPRLSSGRPVVVLASLSTMCVPLLPFLWSLVRGAAGLARRGPPAS